MGFASNYAFLNNNFLIERKFSDSILTAKNLGLAIKLILLP